MNITIIFWIIVVIVLIIFFFGALVQTDEQEVKIIQRFGKYSKTVLAGISWKSPFIESVVQTISLKLQNVQYTVEAKTKDNVFVNIEMNVQYQIPAESAADSYYKLQNPEKQIEAYIFDSVRSQVPTMTLEEVFNNKDLIAQSVDTTVAKQMLTYGYQIINILITEVEPAANVKQALNQVQASTLARQAAEQQGEAQKIILVKQAEAEKATKQLSGEGIAAERQAIVDGLKKSVEELSEATGTTAENAMSILMATQYYDTLKAIGASSKNTIMLPYGADGADKIRESIIAAAQIN